MLSGNLLTGTIPKFLGNLTELTRLELAINPLKFGELPSEIGNLTKLQTLFAPQCNIRGCLPDSIENLVSLKNLDLSNEFPIRSDSGKHWWIEEQEQQLSTRWEGYVDWRSRPAIKGRHGGMLAFFFVLVAEVLENLAYLANSSNLVMYLKDYMHLSPSKAANNVTDFMGTAFLLALLGGFLSDALFTTYHNYLISTVIEFLGLILLTVQARLPSLKPPSCTEGSLDNPCQEVEGGKVAMLFLGLYLVALGVGWIKGSLPSTAAASTSTSPAVDA